VVVYQKTHKGVPMLDEALELTTETAEVDFKGAFAASSPEWCELVKDLVAMANSGGGLVLIGLDDNGNPAPEPPAVAMALDPAQIDDQIYRYTGQHRPELQVRQVEKGGRPVVAIKVFAVSVPIVFLNPGTYADGQKQKTAFGRGTVYFRHGPKSEGGTTEDIRAAFERNLTSRREEWLGNIRQVMEAPPGSTVQIVRSAAPPPPQGEPGVGVRLVHDPSAPTVPHWNPDDTHPHRQKELLAALNERLDGVRVNSFDVQCIRRVHDIDKNPNFYHRSRHGSPQYSNAFLEWVLAEFARDGEFFRSTRGQAQSATRDA
jgi:Putative DNA-binding domain